jgi:hypothetical protein
LASTAGSGVTTLSVDPHIAGDALVVLVHIVASNAKVSSISGGGSSGWARYEQYLDTPSWSGQPHDTEIWVGKVGSTGSSTIRVSYSQSVKSTNIDLDAQEFDAGLGTATTWSPDTGSGQDNDASSTDVPYPALTPSASGELYFGYAWVPGTSAPGSTPGVTYDVTADGNLICFDPDVSTELAPVGSQTAWAPSASIAVLIRAS